MLARPLKVRLRTSNKKNTKSDTVSEIQTCYSDQHTVTLWAGMTRLQFI